MKTCLVTLCVNVDGKKIPHLFFFFFFFGVCVTLLVKVKDKSERELMESVCVKKEEKTLRGRNGEGERRRS